MLSRLAKEVEIAKSVETLNELGRHWPDRLNQEGAKTPLEWTSRWLALAGLCHTMLNSAEFVFVD